MGVTIQPDEVGGLNDRSNVGSCQAQMQHNADLEAENAELRAELAAVAAAREAAEAALSRESAQRAVAAKAAVTQQAWQTALFQTHQFLMHKNR